MKKVLFRAAHSSFKKREEEHKVALVSFKKGGNGGGKSTWPGLKKSSKLPKLAPTHIRPKKKPPVSPCIIYPVGQPCLPQPLSPFYSLLSAVSNCPLDEATAGKGQQRPCRLGRKDLITKSGGITSLLSLCEKGKLLGRKWLAEVAALLSKWSFFRE